MPNPFEGATLQKDQTYKVNYGQAIKNGILNAPRDFASGVSKRVSSGINKTIMGTSAAKIAAKRLPDIPSYKKGGIVKKTGLALVHKGEKVTPVEKAMRKHGDHNKRLAPKKYDLVANIMAYEGGDLDEKNTNKLFKEIRKRGLTNKLQGHYGRESERRGI